MLLHSNLACQVQQIDAWLGGLPRGRETFLAALPLFHVFGMMVCLNLPVWTSAAIVLQPDPRDTAALLEDIGRHRVSILALVPAIFHAINHFPGVERYDLKSIKACLSGSAPLSVETLQRFEELTGGRIFEGYGLTETTAATHVNPLRGLRKIGSVGVPLPDTDARVVDPESGAPMPTGEPGELLVRGPQVMAGYWSAPEQSASALRDGWLATGDLATCDEDGYFRIVGRKKDLINSGGYKVFPDEVDQALARHPAVLESATIGVPDARRGETVKSFVVLRPGSAATEKELVAHCREQLAPYKVPREIEMRASLPRSSVLKVLRRTLLAEELERRKAAP
jgi:long-chain acyl-CoA synthetase